MPQENVVHANMYITGLHCSFGVAPHVDTCVKNEVIIEQYCMSAWFLDSELSTCSYYVWTFPPVFPAFMQYIGEG